MADGGYECVDAFECCGQRVHRCVVYFDDFDAGVVCTWLGSSCENCDLEVCINECLQDMRPESPRCLIEMLEVCLLCLWGGRTPATATDLISDIVVNLRRMLVASGSVKRYLDCSC